MEKWQVAHEALDQKRHEDNLGRFDTIGKSLEGLATKEDTKEILETIHTIKIGFGLFNISGRVVMAVGVALVIVLGGWKILLAWLGLKM